MSNLTTFEWTLLWMAIRYAMNRSTIASATLPEDIMSNWYKRLTNGQKQEIAKELQQHEADMECMGYKGFGHETIDRPHWLRFWKCLDESCHYQVQLTDGTTITVFDVDGKIVPLERYIEEPHRNYFVPPESIKSGPLTHSNNK